MPARTGCCNTDYTTRAYDTSGNTIWSASYYQKLLTFSAIGSAGYSVNSSMIDGSCVYVGGSRVTVSGHSWSLVCIDLVTGQVLWDRDLYVDAGSPSGYVGDVVQLQIDPSGNIVAFLDPQYSAHSGTARKNYFVVIDPSGNFVSTANFTSHSAPNPIAIAVAGVVGFTIDSSGNYHCFAIWPHIFVGTTLYAYEWASPFTSPPVEYDLVTGGGSLNQAGLLSIARFNDRDYFGGTSANLAASSLYKYSSLLRGKSQTAAVHSWNDIDQRLEFWSLSLSAATITATGTTQGTAASLIAGNDYKFNSGSNSKGVILPTGTVGDQIGIALSTSYGNNPVNGPIAVYPPSGGHIIIMEHPNGLITENAVNISVSPGQGDVFTCVATNVWTYLNPLWAATRAGHFADASENLYVTNGLGQTLKYDVNGTLLWYKGQRAKWTTVDGSGNVYANGQRLSSYASVSARDSSGNWLWGHFHHGTLKLTATTIHWDDPDSQIIVSGQVAQKSGDVSFIADPWP